MRVSRISSKSELAFTWAERREAARSDSVGELEESEGELEGSDILMSVDEV